MRRRSKDSMAMLRLVFVLFLVTNPCMGMLQPEHSIWERSLGTTGPGLSTGNRQTQMQVCITIGCCRHVCRQFMGDLGPAPAREDEIPESATRDESTTSTNSIFSQQVAVVPDVLDWKQHLTLFSPSIKHLTVFNTGNDTVLKVFFPIQSNDEQFYSPGSSGDKESTIPPGGSLRIPVVYLPQHLGQASGEFILRTSAGDHAIRVQGQASESPYQLSVQGPDEEHLRQVINFHNPHDQAIQINEVWVWPAESHKGSLCTSEADRVTSCTNQAAKLTGGSSNGFFNVGSEVTFNTRLGTWEIRPGETAEMVALEFPKSGRWTGSLYIQVSRNGLSEVIILPVKMETGETSSDHESELPDIQLGVRTGTTGTGSYAQELSSWKKTQQMAESTLRPLIRELSIILLKQQETKSGSLVSTSQNQAMLVSVKRISFGTVQTKTREQLWIDLVNPTDDPVTVKVEVAPQTKFTDCTYNGNWFWQNHGPQVQQNDGVFDLEDGAIIQAVIPASSKLSFGPLTFSPKGRCDWFGLLFIKNSLSGLEWVPLHGKGGSASLSFLEGSQDGIVQRLHLVQVLGTGMPTTEMCQSRMETTFRVRNTGEMGMSIDGLNMENAVGFKLLTSDRFTLEAGETTDLVISYEPDYQATATKGLLEMATSIGIVQVPVVATVPRELLAICGNKTLEEKVLLPLSICALVLVLGIFSRLLLKELVGNQVTSNTPKPAGRQTWRRLFTIWKSQNSRKLRVPQAERPVAAAVESLKTEQEAEKCKAAAIKRKKKGKNVVSSQPGSPCSSSAPCSPRSTSDSEKKEIDKILDASRFSLSRSLSKKKSRKEKVRLDQAPSAKHVVEEASSSHHHQQQQEEVSNGGSPVMYEAAKAKAKVAKVETQVSSGNSRSEDPPPERHDNVAAPFVPATLRAPGARASTSHDVDDPLTSIGMLRKKAAEVSSGYLEHDPGQYDIWGDHFAKISAGDRPSYNFGHSLFSQSLPTRIQDVSSSSFYCNSSIPSTTATDDELARASFMPSNFVLPTSIEAYPGIPEPSFDFTESIYRSIVS